MTVDVVEGPRSAEDDMLLQLGRAVMEAQPFSRLLQAELRDLRKGYAELAVPVRPDLLQHNGYAHGGVISYLADNAITYAGGSALGPSVLTQEYKISYLRPGRGDELVARASVLFSSKRFAVCRCDVFAVSGNEEELCATSIGTIASAKLPDGAAETAGG